ncbi:VOC family protein [Haliangium sp.]|uniref:VOC family protein n=1 Tax=Haliangium sp. TaxID=2663208 RepID=UPI003D10210B
MAAAGGAPVSFEPGTPAASWRPEGYHSLTPGIVVRNAAAVIDFYVRAFGAVERTRMAMPDGRLMHAEVQIGDSVVMLSDEMPEFGATSPLSLGGTPFGMMLYVDDVDATFAGAVEAGAEAKQPVQDMFWGDRYGMVKDPSGHEWGLATHTRDLTPEQMAEEMKKQFAAPAGE